MELEIRGRHVEITDMLHRYVQRRLGFALDRFADRLGIVRLKVGDMNSSRGGVDKRCQLAISLAHSSPITLESHASTVQGAIDRIAGKVASLVERRFRRKHDHRRFRNANRQQFELPPPLVTTLGLRGGSAP
jgi:putative sigma-54 modulation protein